MKRRQLWRASSGGSSSFGLLDGLVQESPAAMFLTRYQTMSFANLWRLSGNDGSGTGCAIKGRSPSRGTRIARSVAFREAAPVAAVIVKKTFFRGGIPKQAWATMPCPHSTATSEAFFLFKGLWGLRGSACIF